MTGLASRPLRGDGVQKRGLNGKKGRPAERRGRACREERSKAPGQTRRLLQDWTRAEEQRET